MKWLPFFGSSEDDTVERIDASDSDVTVVSNTGKKNVEVVGAEDTSTRSTSSGFAVHTISMGEDAGATTSNPASSRGTATSSPPSSPASPSVEPDPASDTHPRGTFVLPENQHFLQKLEARGKNGHGSIVETVYVLTGASYTQPTDLIRLDNDDYYGSATKTSVSFNPRSMAEKVASLYPDGETPQLIARFHTHPGGTLRPSDADRSSANNVRTAFENAFGTDEFEFFHGIHGLEEHNRSPPPDERQAPSASGHVHWLGERYRHKIAVFGTGFKHKKDVAIE